MAILFYAAEPAPAEIGGIDEYTKLMLHMDGDNDGTVFTDSSASARTMVRNGPVTKTGTKKFGTASGYWDGSAWDLTTPGTADTDFHFGSGDFTLDAWVNVSTGGWLATLQNGPVDLNANWYWTTASFAFFNAAGTEFKVSLVPVDTGVWYHNAIVRNGNTMYGFLNGNLVDTEDVTGQSIRDLGGTELEIGARGGQPAGIPTMYVDELRISKGIARWTSDFTPEGPYTT